MEIICVLLPSFCHVRMQIERPLFHPLIAGWLGSLHHHQPHRPLSRRCHLDGRVPPEASSPGLTPVEQVCHSRGADWTLTGEVGTNCWNLVWDWEQVVGDDMFCDHLVSSKPKKSRHASALCCTYNYFALFKFLYVLLIQGFQPVPFIQGINI